MNDDRISEVYKGEIWQEDAQDRQRRRIHWLCAQSAGEMVLDLGCSQGIASILLGRESFTVVGVDIQTSRIEYALDDLAKESEDVRTRVGFEVGEGSALRFDDNTFDTVILGELLEHTVSPDRVLSEVVRVAKDGGRIVITTPFGFSPHHDHKQTFFPHNVIGLVARYFVLEEVDIVDQYFRIVGAASGPGNAEIALRALDDKVASTVGEIQAELYTAQKVGQRATRRENESAAIVEVQSKEIAELRSELIDARSMLPPLRARLNKLQAEDGKLRHDLSLARWRLKRIRSRKWWRLGTMLGQIRKSPWRLFRSPYDAARIAFGPSRMPPRPSSTYLSDDELPEVIAAVAIPEREVRVATLLEHEDEQQFAYEWESAPLGTDNWRQVLHDHQPRLLIASEGRVASAEWRQEATLMLEAFRNAGAVTALVGTSEPDAHLVEMAGAFDLVLCGSAGTAQTYRSVLQHDRVDVMAPAIQPRIFNPIERRPRTRDLVYLEPSDPTAGSDGVVLPVAVRMGANILARGPKRTAMRIGEALKEFKVAVAPPTAEGGAGWNRELLEIAATNTPIVASAKKGMTVPLASAVVEANAGEELREKQSKNAIKSLLGSRDLRTRLSHRRMRAVMRTATISHRVDQLLQLAGLAEPSPSPWLTMMTATNRPQQLDNILSNLARQTYPSLRAVLVLHGIELDHGFIREEAARHEIKELEILNVDESVILGEVFNCGFAAASTEFVGKMDDDDYYGPEYAADLMDAFGYTEAEIVGKWAHYAYLVDADITVLRLEEGEHTYRPQDHPLLAISTLVMKRSIAEDFKFPPLPSGSGSQFLRNAAAGGARVYSADRFNYLYVRQGESDPSHTWQYPKFDLIANSSFVCQGKNIDHVVV